MLGRYGNGGGYGVVDELPRVYKCDQSPDKQGYTEHDMDLEIQRVAREMYKAFNGLNDGFKEVSGNFSIQYDHTISCYSLRIKL